MKKFNILLCLLYSFSSFGSDKIEMLEQEIIKLTNQVELLQRDMRVVKSQMEQHLKLNLEQKDQDAVPSAHEGANPGAHDQDAVSSAHEGANPQAHDHKQQDAKPPSSMSEKQKYDNAILKLQNNKYAEAREDFDQLMKNPKSNFMERAMFWYAESFFRAKDFQHSAVHYLRCYKKFPKGQKASESLLKVVQSISQRKDKTPAREKNLQICEIIKKLEKDFPSRSASSKKISNDLKIKHNCSTSKPSP